MNHIRFVGPRVTPVCEPLSVQFCGMCCRDCVAIPSVPLFATFSRMTQREKQLAFFPLLPVLLFLVLAPMQC